MDDNLDILAEVLYGRKPTAREYLGGSDCRVLKDAADKLAELKAENAELKELTERAWRWIKWATPDDELVAGPDGCSCIEDDGEECYVCAFIRYFGDKPCRDCSNLKEHIKAAADSIINYPVVRVDYPWATLRTDLLNVLNLKPDDPPTPSEEEKPDD